MKKLAAAALSDGYLKQARYEENDGRWAEASLSYSRAVEGRHGARFDLSSGSHLSPPARAGVAAFKVQIVGNEVHVDLP